jgi:hypothetical protein
MAEPNFRKGPKPGLHPPGVTSCLYHVGNSDTPFENGEGFPLVFFAEDEFI